jgi:hypothetical protein
MNVNIWDVNDDLQMLIRSGQEINRAALGDRDTPLGDLIRQPASTDAQ